MLKSIINYLVDNRDRQRIAIALAKGGAMMQARQIDLTNPATWEFSGFSQNGEDGIIEVLRRHLLVSNRDFLEIGSANGVENNSAWLTVAERYAGLMIEGNPRLVERARRNVVGYSIGAQCQSMFVTLETVPAILNIIQSKTPDVFSLDIDGNDYHIARALIDGGLRPKIIVAEYNSAYGLERKLSIVYKSDFSIKSAHPSGLYYGVSIAGWRQLLERKNYRFVTVDRNGVNAFFADENFFESKFLDGIHGSNFAENRAQFLRFNMPSEEQFSIIADQKFISI